MTVERTRTLHWYEEPVAITAAEYAELRKLAYTDPVAANNKAEEYWKRQCAEESGE